MKKLLLVIPLLWASSLEAQETYSISATAGQINNFVDPGRRTHNERSCYNAGLALDCTEAQLQAVAGFETTDIYPDSQVGREEYVVDIIISPRIPELKTEMQSWDSTKAKINFDALDTTGKNAVCSALGLPNGCDPFP
jgi:hypothetical protein